MVVIETVENEPPSKQQTSSSSSTTKTNPSPTTEAARPTPRINPKNGVIGTPNTNWQHTNLMGDEMVNIPLREGAEYLPHGCQHGLNPTIPQMEGSDDLEDLSATIASLFSACLEGDDSCPLENPYWCNQDPNAEGPQSEATATRFTITCALGMLLSQPNYYLLVTTYKTSLQDYFLTAFLDLIMHQSGFEVQAMVNYHLAMAVRIILADPYWDESEPPNNTNLDCSRVFVVGDDPLLFQVRRDLISSRFGHPPRS